MSKFPLTETTSGNCEDQLEAIATSTGALDDAIATDDSAATATPKVVLVGGEYRSSATTYTDGDACVLQTDVNGYLKTSGGSSDYSATDDSAADATPTIALVGGEYRASPTTYTDGDACVLQTDVNGYLKTSGASADYSATDDSAADATPTIALVGGEYRSSATTYTDGDATVMQTDVNGNLKCNIQSGGAEPQYTDTQMLTNQAADNSAPSGGSAGTALQSNTKDAYISVVANTDVTNADINIWAYEQGTDVWFLVPGGSMDDLQSETDDRWGMMLKDIKLYADRVYVEVDNYADGGSGTINAYLRERTT